MGRFIIEGGRPLKGKLSVQGAKNAALPILAASILSKGDIVLQNCPDIVDVENMLGILAEIGVERSREGAVLRLNASGARSAVMPPRLSKELRSSIFMLGPLLSRFGWAVCSYPGGCEIGHRPVDLHLKGLSSLGAVIREERGRLICDGRAMRGTDIHLDYPSVGATENVMMAAVSADGETCITNAAREPEIEDLQRFLNAIGCSVSGAGTSSITIRGGMEHRAAVTHRIMPDRIAAGTYMCACAMAGGEVRLENVCCEHLASMTAKLREAGCRIETAGESLTISMAGRPGEIKLIETLPYPGFPTDMQAQFFALCCISQGTSVIVENVFENRFRHGGELIKMGAAVTQKDRTAVVRGVERLYGAHVTAHDLRGGAALVIAALAAEGRSIVENTGLIDRGYQALDAALNSIGAQVTRESGE